MLRVEVAQDDSFFITFDFGVCVLRVWRSQEVAPWGDFFEVANFSTTIICMSTSFSDSVWEEKKRRQNTQQTFSLNDHRDSERYYANFAWLIKAIDSFNLIMIWRLFFHPSAFCPDSTFAFFLETLFEKLIAQWNWLVWKIYRVSCL